MKFIGDIHGDYRTYLDIISDGQASIQVGDMGFDYNPIRNVDSQHKFIGGNHDNYSVLKDNPPRGYLGDYGTYDGIGYVRGAYSIDQHSRIIGHDWWPEEELNFRESSDCLDYFIANKVDVVVSHDCPQFVADSLFGIDSSNTRLLLNEVHMIVKPKIWVFGHHHRDIDIVLDKTRFICVNIGKTFVVF